VRALLENFKLAFSFIGMGIIFNILSWLVWQTPSFFGTIDLAIGIALLLGVKSKVVYSFAKAFGYASFGIAFLYLFESYYTDTLIMRLIISFFTVIAFVFAFLTFALLREMKERGELDKSVEEVFK